MGIGAACGGKDVLSEIVEIAAGVGIVEAFGGAVDVDTRVWAPDLDPRIGSILMINRQEALAE